jgi:translocation and assembly module TamA
MRRRPAGLLLLLAGLLALCAALPSWAQQPADNAASAPDASASAPGSERMAWRLDVQAPDDLRELLLRYLDLARFQRDASSESITPGELARLVAAAPAQVRSLLETQGYFEPGINAALEPAPPGGVPVVRLRVEPGPRTEVGRLTIEMQGDLLERADSGEPHARELLERMNRQWPLSPGTAFTDSTWTSAKAAALTLLRTEGYPLANWVGTGAQVDAATRKVRVFVVADSGPRFFLGPLRIEGLQYYGEDAVRNVAPFKAGEPYSEKRLLDYQERLVKTGLFDSAVVTLDPDESQAGAAPVLVQLSERPRKQLTFGVGVSTDAGPRTSVEFTHRKPFGLDWQARTKLELARDGDSSFTLDLTSHPKPGNYRNLASFAIKQEEAAGVTVDSRRARLGRTQDTEHIERLYYLEWERAMTRSGDDRDSADAVSANYEWIWRRLDDNLMPTRGIAASAKLGGGRSFRVFSTLDDQVPGWFTRAVGRLTWYQPLGNDWYLQTRAEAGEVFARSNVALPYTLLFRAGGDNSVRGYAYQSLGPSTDGVNVGGRVLATGSVELAHPFTRRRPEFLWAVFADAGNADRDWKDFKPALGYGVGARWRSPIGPVAVDLAYGQEVRKARLHLNVGVSF